jgi:cytochrome c oxidase cbb3-type subunit II
VRPKDVIPESIMPPYSFLARTRLEVDNMAGHLRANALVGVPYSEDMIENAEADLRAQATPDADTSGLEERYAKISIRDFDGNPRELTEMDALVAYLQMLGTLVDLEAYKANESLR